MYVRIKQAVVELDLVSKSQTDAFHVAGNKLNDVEGGKGSAMLVP